jgi:hypothetical protein
MNERLKALRANATHKRTMWVRARRINTAKLILWSFINGAALTTVLLNTAHSRAWWISVIALAVIFVCGVQTSKSLMKLRAARAVIATIDALNAATDAMYTAFGYTRPEDVTDDYPLPHHDH